MLALLWLLISKYIQIYKYSKNTSILLVPLLLTLLSWNYNNLKNLAFLLRFSFIPLKCLNFYFFSTGKLLWLLHEINPFWLTFFYLPQKYHQQNPHKTGQWESRMLWGWSRGHQIPCPLQSFQSLYPAPGLQGGIN